MQCALLHFEIPWGGSENVNVATATRPDQTGVRFLLFQNYNSLQLTGQPRKHSVLADAGPLLTV